MHQLPCACQTPILCHAKLLYIIYIKSSVIVGITHITSSSSCSTEILGISQIICNGEQNLRISLHFLLLSAMLLNTGPLFCSEMPPIDACVSVCKLSVSNFENSIMLYVCSAPVTGWATEPQIRLRCYSLGNCKEMQGIVCLLDYYKIDFTETVETCVYIINHGIILIVIKKSLKYVVICCVITI